MGHLQSSPHQRPLAYRLDPKVCHALRMAAYGMIVSNCYRFSSPQRIVLEARKNVPGMDGRPSQMPINMDAGFMEGREHLKVYHQALMGLISVGLGSAPPI